MALRCWLIASVVLVMSGCMSAPPAPAPDDSVTTEIPDDWSSRRKALSRFNQWRLLGKVAVNHQEGNDSALIREWTQNGKRFFIEMSSAFMGMGTVRLAGSPDFLKITDSEGQVHSSRKPDQLIRETLGWTLPVEALYFWVRGLPIPDSEYQLFFHPDGRIAYLRQLGWELHYDQHQRIGDLPRVPRSLTATRGHMLRLRLVMTQWQPL